MSFREDSKFDWEVDDEVRCARHDEIIDCWADENRFLHAGILDTSLHPERYPEPRRRWRGPISATQVMQLYAISRWWPYRSMEECLAVNEALQPADKKRRDQRRTETAIQNADQFYRDRQFRDLAENDYFGRLKGIAVEVNDEV